MSEVLILPFFNRYCGRTISQSPSGIIAYGARCDIIVIDVLGNRALILDSKSIHLAHRERITGVSFCKKNDVELLATVGDEGIIKVWDLETKTCVNETKAFGNVAEWAHNNSDVLFFLSDSKHLAKWFLSTDTVRKIKTESEMPITILASNETNLLAAGHHNGTITIFDVIQENILQKLKAHSQEILSLSWNPTSPEMLLTASFDLSLRLWKIGEDKPVNSYYVPVGRVRYEDKKKVNIVGTWHPRNHDMAICSNFRGDWGEVCLSKGETPKFSTLSYDLNSKGFIFCFSFSKKTAQGIQNLLIIFDTYKLSVWNVCEKKLELQVPILTGFIYGLSFSSINPNLLAMGNGDGTVKIWNAQAESAEKNVMGIYVHFKVKIMTVAWHPLYENIIAYGTDEGRVAIIDLFKKKSVYTFETYHSDKVYTVCWGPFKQGKGKVGKGPKEDEYFVYSCGSSTIFINRLNYSKEPAYDFDDFANLPSHLESNKRTYAEINWKPDFSYLLIGSYRGFIDLYNDELVFLNRYSVEIKNVECLTWHPKRTYESPDRSPLEFWFAACGNDADIYLFNSTKTCVKQSQGEDDSKEWESKRLVGHKKRVVRVCWSQHNDGFLASASKDGSVLIWNACTGVILASYLCHQDNVLAVQWSVTDHDVIYSAGEDSCVRVWKISEQAVINPSSEGPPKRRLRRRHRNNNAKQLIRKAEISVEAENGEPLESTILIDGDEHNPNDENDDEDFPTVETRDINSKGLPVSGKKTLTETDRKQLRAQGLSRKGLPQLFPFHSLMSDASIENELKDCLQLADALKAKKNVPSDETQIFDLSEHSVNTLADEDILKLGPFMDQMTALKMLEVQAENFKLLKTFRHFCHLSVMSSNVKALIEYAAANKKLSTFHVSLAPSVSYSYWFEVCEKYAKQLIEAHQYNQACMYLLVCNKVNEAIDIWADKIDVIEALVLAKARLPESDPKIRTLLHRARKRYVSHYNQARIAKCLLALDQPFTAAKTLFFVSDPKFMKAGIYIAKLYELDDVAKKYVYFYMVKCLSIDDWNALTELVNEEPSMKVYSSLFAVHKAFKIHLQYLRNTDKNLEEEILFQPNSSKPVKFWIGSTCMESKESFIKHVYRILLSNNLLPSKTDEIFDILKVLGNMFAKKTYDCEIQADILVSLCITQFIFYCVLEDRTAANFYFLKIFESSFKESFLFKAVCSLFIPMDLSWNCNTHSIICESRTENNKENDANAIMCQFRNINQAIAEEIMSFRLDKIISKFHPQDDCPLSPLHENVVDVLKSKPVNEYVLAYFIANLAQIFKRLVERTEMICYAEKTCLPELQKEDMKPIIPSEKLEDGLPIQNSSVHMKTGDESNKNIEAINSDEENEIKNLINIVLEEANEKAKLLSKSKANTVPENVVDNDAAMQESKILEDNSQCIAQEKKSCVDINDENSSKIITGTNVTNDVQLPKKLMNEERNEKESSMISSNEENLAISQCIDLEKKTIDEEKSSNIIIETDVINDAELPKNPAIEERNEKECSAISSNDEHLAISQCIDLEKKTIDDEKSSNIIIETDVINDAELPTNPVIEERNEKECSAISSNDENLVISQCIDLEKKTIDEEKSSNIIFETDVINDAELPKNPVIEERIAISSNDENLEISQCIYPEKKSYAGINEEKSTEITTVTDVKNDTELLKKLINEGRNGKECLPTSVKNSHVQCLANSHLFLNVALFIVSSISKQEFSCAYSSESACIKKKSELLKNTKKVESFDELNANIDKIASSETEELHSSGSFEIIENGEIANMVLKIDEKENNDEKQIVECANCIQSVDLSKRNDNVDGIPCTEINMEINNFDKILTDSSTTTSETDVVKKGNKKEIPNESNMECDKNISNSEIVGCDLVVVDSHYNSDSSEMGLSSLSESCANSFQIISPFGEDILKELKTIEGKIHVLIKESYPSLLSYPDPFETLQNVFQVLYSMWQKSECSVAREELHKYMDQIIQYSHSFFDGKMELRCEICFSK